MALTKGDAPAAADYNAYTKTYKTYEKSFKPTFGIFDFEAQTLLDKVFYFRSASVDSSRNVRFESDNSSYFPNFWITIQDEADIVVFEYGPDGAVTNPNSYDYEAQSSHLSSDYVQVSLPPSDESYRIRIRIDRTVVDPRFGYAAKLKLYQAPNNIVAGQLIMHYSDDWGALVETSYKDGISLTDAKKGLLGGKDWEA